MYSDASPFQLAAVLNEFLASTIRRKFDDYSSTSVTGGLLANSMASINIWDSKFHTNLLATSRTASSVFSSGRWGTPKILRQFLHFFSIRVKQTEIWGAGACRVALLWEGFVVSDLFITRFT